MDEISRLQQRIISIETILKIQYGLSGKNRLDELEKDLQSLKSIIENLPKTDLSKINKDIESLKQNYKDLYDSQIIKEQPKSWFNIFK